MLFSLKDWSSAMGFCESGEGQEVVESGWTMCLKVVEKGRER
jgi:hypothetical protein